MIRGWLLRRLFGYQRWTKNVFIGAPFHPSTERCGSGHNSYLFPDGVRVDVWWPSFYGPDAVATEFDLVPKRKAGK